MVTQRLVPRERDVQGADGEWTVNQVRVWPSAAAIRQAEAAMNEDEEDE